MWSSPSLHGTYGEDGTLQGLLEMADLAYVGAGVTGSSVGMDKGVFKDVMRAIGIPTVESIIVLRSEIEKDIEAVIRRAETVAAYPLFVKPANLGSSVGITKCNQPRRPGRRLCWKPPPMTGACWWNAAWMPARSRFPCSATTTRRPPCPARSCPAASFIPMNPNTSTAPPACSSRLPCPPSVAEKIRQMAVQRL